jgi:hypothetical protein
MGAWDMVMCRTVSMEDAIPTLWHGGFMLITNSPINVHQELLNGAPLIAGYISMPWLI